MEPAGQINVSSNFEEQDIDPTKSHPKGSPLSSDSSVNSPIMVVYENLFKVQLEFSVKV